MTQRTIEWLNANAKRRYPFADDADAGIDDSVILDCCVTVIADVYDGTGVKLVSVVSYPGTAGLLFRFMAGALTFTAEVPGSAAFPYQVSGSGSGCYYSVTFGDGCVAMLSADGAVTECDGRLLPALVCGCPRQRVNSVAAAGAYQSVLDGRIYIEPGYNCDPVVQSRRIKLVAGAGYGAGRDCVPAADGVISCRNALLRLNGQTASEDGNINIKVLGARITADPANHRLVIDSGNQLDNSDCS